MGLLYDRPAEFFFVPGGNDTRGVARLGHGTDSRAGVGCGLRAAGTNQRTRCLPRTGVGVARPAPISKPRAKGLCSDQPVAARGCCYTADGSYDALPRGLVCREPGQLSSTSFVPRSAFIYFVRTREAVTYLSLLRVPCTRGASGSFLLPTRLNGLDIDRLIPMERNVPIAYAGCGQVMQAGCLSVYENEMHWYCSKSDGDVGDVKQFLVSDMHTRSREEYKEIINRVKALYDIQLAVP